MTSQVSWKQERRRTKWRARPGDYVELAEVIGTGAQGQAKGGKMGGGKCAHLE